MTATNDQYALNWSNYVAHVKKAFDSLLATNEFVDVTLACEGRKIGAHKMLLSACSTYFHDLFRENPCQHPIVMLKDVKYEHLVNILTFIYNGEVSVSIDTFDTFLKTAEFLQISGLTDDEGHFATADKEGVLMATENTTNEQTEIKETKPLAKVESVIEKPAEKPVGRRSDKLKDTKRKTTEKSELNTVTSKRRKEILPVKEPIILKQEVSVQDEDKMEDPLDISIESHHEDNSFLDEEDSEFLQPSANPQRFSDVQDLLNAKYPKAAKSKIHRLEERIGKLEASRSYCKGCFVKTCLGQLTKNNIKRVNTFCPGCEGLPNYCKSCFVSHHQGMKNVVL